MFSKLAPSLFVLSALCGSYAMPQGGGVSYILPDLPSGASVTMAVVGTPSTNGPVTYSIGFAFPTATASTATAPDTTITAAATLIEGSTEAHLVEIVTVGTDAVTFNEDCGISNGHGVCTIVGKNAAFSFSTVATVTGAAAGVVTASAVPANGAGRMGAMGAGALAALVAGVTVVGAIL